MAGIDFDRQAFVSATEKSPRFGANVVGAAILIAAIALAGIVAYKLIPTFSAGATASQPTDAATLTQVQQQLEELQKRLDTLEKHRKTAPESAKAPETVASAPVVKTASARPAYRIASGVPQRPNGTRARPRSPA